jgi:uncharacterized protein (TIGR03085 family)
VWSKRGVESTYDRVMSTIAQYERNALATALETLGPDAPTLCAGWTTRDLAAHVVSRERRADAAIGLAVKPLAGHTASVQRSYAQRPYDELVQQVRAGAPLWSAFGWPGVDRLLNTTEYFVHHEDIRRAQPGWEPRELPAKVQDGLWQAVKGRAKMSFGGTSFGVTLTRPDGESIVATSGEPMAVLTGEPAELLLYLFGRRDQARVDLSGPPEALDQLAGTSLDV